MDLGAVLARAPQVALVDELAHTNIPGSQHTKRWQDMPSSRTTTVTPACSAGLSAVPARLTKAWRRKVDVAAMTAYCHAGARPWWAATPDRQGQTRGPAIGSAWPGVGSLGCAVRDPTGDLDELAHAVLAQGLGEVLRESVVDGPSLLAADDQARRAQ